jgi:hypothetical protein
MPTRTIGDWTEVDLRRFLVNMGRTSSPLLPAAADFDQTTVKSMLEVGDELRLSQQAVSYIKDKLQLPKIFNVMAFGAVGDGAADDTVPIQKACDAAALVNGTVWFPIPPVAYKVTGTVFLRPPTGRTECYINLFGEGGQTVPIKWAGGNNASVISTKGWRFSRAENIHIRIPTGKTGVRAWDIDNNLTTDSTTVVTFTNCSAFFEAGATSGYGWRLGASGVLSDISCINWENCSVYAAAIADLNVGWSIEQANAISFNWYGGIGFHLDKMVNLVFGEGLATFGLCGTHNNNDFVLGAPGALTVNGGRFELGNRMLYVSHNTNAGQTIRFEGVKAYKYAPADGMVFFVLGTPALILDGCEIVNRSAADYTNVLVSMYCDGAGRGTLSVRGGVVQGPDPFFRVIGGSTAVFTTMVTGTVLVNNSGVSTGSIHNPSGVNLPTFGATVTVDSSKCEYHQITVTSNINFTVNITNPVPGRKVIVDVFNANGAMGTVTWNSTWLMQPFVNPVLGSRRVMTLVYDGSNWVQCGNVG